MPQQTIDKLHKASMSFTENGLLQFALSMAKYSIQLWSRTHLKQNNNQSEFSPITMKEFQNTLIEHFSHLGTFFLIFVLEIIWYYIKQRWNQGWNNFIRQFDFVMMH